MRNAWLLDDIPLLFIVIVFLDEHEAVLAWQKDRFSVAKPLEIEHGCSVSLNFLFAKFNFCEQFNRSLVIYELVNINVAVAANWCYKVASWVDKSIQHTASFMTWLAKYGLICVSVVNCQMWISANACNPACSIKPCLHSRWLKLHQHIWLLKNLLLNTFFVSKLKYFNHLVLSAKNQLINLVWR